MNQPANEANPSGSSTTAGSLIEHAAPIIKLLADLGGEGAPKEAEQLRTRFEELFRGYESRAIRAGYTESEATAGKYALAAVVDETILLSELPVKDAWMGKPLQMIFFDDFSAGEEFYVKLDTVRTARSPRSADVLEIFHLCLALGFKGKHGDARGAERRRVLMDAVAAEISQARGVGADSPLSPAGLPPGTGGAQASPLRLLGAGPLWIVPLAVVVVLFILLIVLGVVDDRALAGIPGEGAPTAGAKP